MTQPANLIGTQEQGGGRLPLPSSSLLRSAGELSDVDGEARDQLRRVFEDFDLARAAVFERAGAIEARGGSPQGVLRTAEDGAPTFCVTDADAESDAGTDGGTFCPLPVLAVASAAHSLLRVLRSQMEALRRNTFEKELAAAHDAARRLKDKREACSDGEGLLPPRAASSDPSLLLRRSIPREQVPDGATVLPACLTLPRGTPWSPIKKNLRRDDDPVLRYIPYFGENDDNSLDVSAFESLPGEKHGSTMSTCLEDETILLTLCLVDGTEVPDTVLWQGLALALGTTSTFAQEAWNALTPAGLSASPLDVLRRRAAIAEDCAQQRAVRGERCRNCFFDTTKDGDTDPVTLGTLRDLFCRRCFVFDCSLHGTMHVAHHQRRDPPCAADPPVGPFRSAADILSAIRTVADKGRIPADATCGLEALFPSQPRPAKKRRKGGRARSATGPARSDGGQVHRAGQRPEPAACPRSAWTPLEDFVIARGLRVFKKGALGPCSAMLPHCARGDIEEALEDARASASSCGSLRGAAADRQEEGASDVDQALKSQCRQVPPHSSACAHTGPCTADTCACVASGQRCSKFCACHGSSCAHQWRGCNCRKGYCRTTACPCYAARKSCDPDLCHSCGASIDPCDRPRAAHLLRCASKVLDAWQRAEEAGNKGGGTAELDGDRHSVAHDIDRLVELRDTQLCANVGLLHGLQKHLSMGRSSIHGWGVFARECIYRNEFISEYRGELITQMEADRRGKIYDRLNCSFLFNLNEGYVIDATRCGNKIRFANHSHNPNCVARIENVNGDYRIGIYAKADIRPDEELTFDYAYRHADDDQDAPMWSKSVFTID